MSDAFEPACSTRLSIIIPAVDDATSMEETLVSVLERRPDDCEIVVVLGCDYADPWNIREEVRFIQAPRGSSLVTCVNLGLAASTGEVVHVLASGWRATDGWTDPPLVRFEEDEDIAAVIPLGVAPADRDRVVSAGVRYAAGGRRIDVVAENERASHSVQAGSVRGPLLEVGFWRADALAVSGVGFSQVCGQAGADADMAVGLARAGWQVVVESESVVVAPSAAVAAGELRSFASGLYAERLFWRSLAGSAPISAIPLHCLEIIRHAVALAPLGTLPMLLGRAAAVLQFGSFLPRYLQLRRVIREAVARRRERQSSEGMVFRIDGPHAAPGRPHPGRPTVYRKSA